MNTTDPSSVALPRIDESRGRITVLIVDDSADFRAAAVRFLRTLPHVVLVGEARDGIEALQMVDWHAPDLALMDLTMPLMDGVEATRALKARPAPAPKIIILTADAGSAYRAAALDAGADGFVAKADVVEQLPLLLRKMFPQS